MQGSSWHNMDYRIRNCSKLYETLHSKKWIVRRWDSVPLQLILGNCWFIWISCRKSLSSKRHQRFQVYFDICMGNWHAVLQKLVSRLCFDKWWTPQWLSALLETSRSRWWGKHKPRITNRSLKNVVDDKVLSVGPTWNDPLGTMNVWNLIHILLTANVIENRDQQWNENCNESLD